MRVRFQEVDLLEVVWHGHYVSYFEEGRLGFGEQFGFSYQDVLAAGFIVPVVHLELDYLAPARFGDRLTVRARLHPEPAARVSFSYVVARGEQVLATGRTVQIFTDPEGQLLMTRPPYYEEFLAKWQDALIQP